MRASMQNTPGCLRHICIAQSLYGASATANWHRPSAATAILRFVLKGLYWQASIDRRNSRKPEMCCTWYAECIGQLSYFHVGMVRTAAEIQLAS